MRISSYAVARPAYYDRNATGYAAQYDASGVAPHAATVRVTNTIAAGRKFILEYLNATMNRQTAAAVAGDVYIGPYVTVGGSEYAIYRLYSNSNTAGATTIAPAITSVTLYAGEILKVYSTDSSTGGTYWYTVGIKGTAFDA